MKKNILNTALLVICMLCCSCDWVKDDLEECPDGFWLKLHYTYNILDVEAAPKYITDASVYVYDADGNYIKRIDVNQATLAANDYRVKVEGLPEGDYQFVVWSGLGNSQYSVTNDTQAIGDFQMSLYGENSSYAEDLPSLYHGYQPVVHFDDAHTVHDVEMMKNTNQLACLVVSVSEMTDMQADDFSLKVVAANSAMNAYNEIVTDEPTVYEPIEQKPVSINDSDYGELHGVEFNIKTLRLMDDHECRIILQQKSTGNTIFNISFTEYIGMIGSLYTNLGRQLSVQEYLDRQDFYTIVFLLSADLDQLLQIQVNSWRLRAYNHLKL